MHHEPNEPRPLDPGRIHPADPGEVGYWCREFQCTEEELRAAIDRVGEHVAALRAEFEARDRL